MQPGSVGKHLIADFLGATRLTEMSAIEGSMVGAVKVSGATLLNIQLHHFGGSSGVTGVALLSESHLSLHTWPETSYVAIDAFMCGKTEPYRAIEHLRDFFQPAKSHVRVIERPIRSN